MSRVHILSLVAVAAGAFGFVSYRATGSRMDGWSGQLFWMTLGVLLTGFLLESLLTRDVEHRRRLEDGFALRTFAAAMLTRLLEIVGDDPSGRETAFAAVEGPAVFAAEARRVADNVISAHTFRPDLYHRSYLDFQVGLKDLGRNYIRLFATSRAEMSKIYMDVLELAQRWEYLDLLSPGAREGAQEAQARNDAAQAERYRRQYVDAEEIAVTVVRDTAEMLAELSRRATGPGMPAAP